MLFSVLLSSFLSLLSPKDSSIVDTSITKIEQDSISLNSIVITGNKKTKERVIKREITIQLNKKYSRSDLNKEIKQSHSNIYNTSMFNFVEVKDSINVLYIDVTERWYIWPIPVLQFADQNINTWWKTKDLKRLNYGLYIAHRNLTGNRDYLYLRYQTGFTDKYEIQYKIPNFDKKQQLSAFTRVYYTESKKQAYATFNNKQEFPNIESNNHIARNFFSEVAIEYRKKIFTHHSISVNYSKFLASDSIVIKNPNYLGNSNSELGILSSTYTLIHDKRDTKAYALNGWYLETNIGANFLFGTKNIGFASTEFKKYYPVKGKLYGATSFKYKISNNFEQPFVVQNALGYSNSDIGYQNLVRAFEFNVVDGQQYMLAKSDIKYPILKSKETTVENINEKFGKIHYAIYLNSFIDAGYVKNVNSNPTNQLDNSLLLGYGIGLNYVTYYDLVYRFEYAFNNKGQQGFFIHFVTPI